MKLFKNAILLFTLMAIYSTITAKDILSGITAFVVVLIMAYLLICIHYEKEKNSKSSIIATPITTKLVLADKHKMTLPETVKPVVLNEVKQPKLRPLTKEEWESIRRAEMNAETSYKHSCGEALAQSKRNYKVATGMFAGSI